MPEAVSKGALDNGCLENFLEIPRKTFRADNNFSKVKKVSKLQKFQFSKTSLHFG